MFEDVAPHSRAAGAEAFLGHASPSLLGFQLGPGYEFEPRK